MSTGGTTLFGEADEKLSQEEVDKYLRAASGETDAGNRMDIQKLYDEYVSKIHKIDIQIAELKGKREAYNEIRLDLFNELAKDKEQES